MRVISINTKDSVNSITGFTTTIYFAGCLHNCEGCYNKQTHDYECGKEYTKEELYDIIISSGNKNVSFSGGDPLYPKNRREVVELIEQIKTNTNIIVYLWTGYRAEYVETIISLKLIDYLIDGKFELKNKDLRLLLRGISNQRIFGGGVLYEDDASCIADSENK